MIQTTVGTTHARKIHSSRPPTYGKLKNFQPSHDWTCDRESCNRAIVTDRLSIISLQAKYG